MNAVALASNGKTHYRKAFDSPYLSSADITEPTVLTVVRVTLEKDKTKKTQDFFNTAYFGEKELRPGETLKPMILNATNSKMMAAICASKFIDDWRNVPITVYVDSGVRFGKETVDGLRIKMAPTRQAITPANTKMWERAKAAFKRDGNLERVLERADMSREHQEQLMSECAE